MKTTINLYQFREAFRAIRPNNFTHEGLEVLFDYLECLEQDTGEELELDVIALCGDYSEDHYKDIAKQSGIAIEGMDEEEAVETLCEWLGNNTTVLGTTSENNIVYCSSF